MHCATIYVEVMHVETTLKYVKTTKFDLQTITHLAVLLYVMHSSHPTHIMVYMYAIVLLCG